MLVLMLCRSSLKMVNLDQKVGHWPKFENWSIVLKGNLIFTYIAYSFTNM